jgi:hypothetical protein
LETVVFGKLSIGQVAIGIGKRNLIFFIPYIRNTFEEQQRKNELFLVAGINQAAQ